MTMSILPGFGGVSQRSGERGGKPAAESIAEAFGQLVGKGDGKMPAGNRPGLDDNPRTERPGAGRELLGMYDLRLRRLGDGTAMPRSLDGEVEPAIRVDDPGNIPPPAETGRDGGETDDAAAVETVTAPVPAAPVRPQAGDDAGPVQAGAGADAARTDDDAQTADVEPTVIADAPVRDDTPPGIVTDDAGMQSRVATQGQGVPGSERSQRTSRTAPAAPQPQAGSALPANAGAAQVPTREPPPDDAGPVQRAPVPNASPDQAMAGDRDRPAQRQAGRAAAAASLPASEPADPFAGRVKVLAAATAPASPPPALVSLLGPTSASVVAAIEADPAWRAAAAEMASSATVRTPNSVPGVNSLRIQLHPAELGMVTARLTATGTQLSIEIQVESNDARQRLANDSDAIVKALRSVGLEVDRITIQQSTAPSTGAGQSAAGGRDQQFAGQQAQGDGHGRERGDGRQAGNQDRDNARAGMAERTGGRPGGDLYI